MQKFDVVCVGGAIIDLIGKPQNPLIQRVSNPGKIRMAYGGVARNIAQNLCLLGKSVSLITAFGSDGQGTALQEDCRENGIDLQGAAVLRDCRSSTILFIEDESGQMQLGLADLSIYDQLTPDFFKERIELLNSARAVVLDTNLPESSIRWIVEHCKVPLFMDPVSAIRAERMLPVLGGLYGIKPNRAEASAMTGIPIDGMQGVAQAAETFLCMGVKVVCITLGADGVYCATEQNQLYLPCKSQKIAADTGAGDAFFAAMIWAVLEGLDLSQIARAGMAASSMALACTDAVNRHLSADVLWGALQ